MKTGKDMAKEELSFTDGSIANWINLAEKMCGELTKKKKKKIRTPIAYNTLYYMSKAFYI